jgi:hypothetical protein
MEQIWNTIKQLILHHYELFLDKEIGIHQMEETRKSKVDMSKLDSFVCSLDNCRGKGMSIFLDNRSIMCNQCSSSHGEDSVQHTLHKIEPVP